jgi:hypothetical protein
MKCLASLALACIAALTLSFLISCSDAVNEPVASQQQAASTLYGAINGSTSMPFNTNRFCRMEYFGATNGHAGSASWPNGVPKEGATWGAWPPSLTAFPYSTSLGSAIAYALCQDKSDFGITGGQSSDTSPFYLLWNTSFGQSYRDGLVSLWSEQAFCWLNGTIGLSASNELAEVFPPPSGTGNWTLYVAGYPGVGGSAKCIHPNRSWTLQGPYVATSGQTTVGPSATNSFCGFSKVTGNLDGGYIWIRQQWGFWTIEASGVTGEMRCAVF